MNWRQHFASRLCSADAAVQIIKSGDHVVVAHACGEPQTLTKALSGRYEDLNDVKVIHRIGLGQARYAQADMAGHFRHISLFAGPSTRQAIQEGSADFLPRFISETPDLFLNGDLPVDVAMITVSPPDKHGYLSLGVSVDYSLPAARAARVVIAQVNPRMPRTHGDTFLSALDIDYFVLQEEVLLEMPPPEITPVEENIGGYIADLIEDGSTIQMGIGAIPDAVLRNLSNKKDLGVHTEMFSDGIIDLVEKGIITGAKKTLHPYKILATFIMGTKTLYDWVHDNPIIEMRTEEYVNDPLVIMQNYQMISINSALQVDVLGQVAADTIGPRQFSGVGGQVDFIRGVRRSLGGKSIIALPSTASGGKNSRITASLYEGTAVTTSRHDVDYVVTEYGVAQLRGKTNLQRMKALLNISHPDFRDEIKYQANQLYYQGRLD